MIAIWQDSLEPRFYSLSTRLVIDDNFGGRVISDTSRNQYEPDLGPRIKLLILVCIIQRSHVEQQRHESH